MEFEFLPGELVYVSWRRYKKWPAYIVGPSGELGKMYDVMYFGQELGYQGAKYEPNVISSRIQKSSDFNVNLRDICKTESVGKKIRVKWNKGIDAEYFLAEIKNYDKISKKHTIYYFEDELEEAIEVSTVQIQIGSPSLKFYPITPEKYNLTRQKAKKQTVKRKKLETNARKKKRFAQVTERSVYKKLKFNLVNDHIENKRSNSSIVESDVIDITARNEVCKQISTDMCIKNEGTALQFNDFKSWLTNRKRRWKINRKERYKLRNCKKYINSNKYQHPIRSTNFPPGTVCYLKPKRKSGLFWPGIVINEKYIEYNNEVYSWYMDTIVPKYQVSILFFCFGSNNFSSSNSGDLGLRPWGNGNLHIVDVNERNKLKTCRRGLLTQYKAAIREAAIQNNKKVEDRLFGKMQSIYVEEETRSNDDDNVIDTKLLRCEICGSLYDDDMMLLCDNCPRAIHIYCAAYPLHDSFDLQKDEHWCQFCMTPVIDNNKSDSIVSSNDNSESASIEVTHHTLVDIKSENNEFLYFSSNSRNWIKASLLLSSDIQLFYSSVHFKRAIVRGQKFGSAVEPFDSHFSREHNDGTVSSYVKRKWRFLNGTYTGITQIIDYFKPEEIKALKVEANMLLDSVGSKQIKVGKRVAPLKNILKRTKTLDENIHKKRVKLFLGYRYAYGTMLKENQQKKSRLYNDVDSMAVSESLVVKLKDEISTKLKLTPTENYINQAVLNYYIQAGSSLGVHQDDKHLFHRPIISIRLLSDSILSFGCKGMGMQETAYFFPIEQKVGTITIMEGFAADNMLHCIRSRDIQDKSLSIIFRKVTEKAIKEMHLLNLKRERAGMKQEDILRRNSLRN
jgi:hypothetical protein